MRAGLRESIWEGAAGNCNHRARSRPILEDASCRASGEFDAWAILPPLVQEDRYGRVPIWQAMLSEGLVSRGCKRHDDGLRLCRGTQPSRYRNADSRAG